MWSHPKWISMASSLSSSSIIIDITQHSEKLSLVYRVAAKKKNTPKNKTKQNKKKLIIKKNEPTEITL